MPAGAAAQCVVTGTVQTHDEAVIPGARVHLSPPDRHTFTTREGRFRFTGLDSGRCVLRVDVVGHHSRIDTLQLHTGDVLTLPLTLDELHYSLATIEVQGIARGAEHADAMPAIALTPADIAARPGAVEDVLRTLQTLPGIASSGDYSAQLHVRGSSPEENVMTIDGVEIVNPYRLYGGVSMFNPALVRSVRFHPGGWPVQFGDGLSAVVEVDTRDGQRDRPLAAALHMSIANANIVCEGPLTLRAGWESDTLDDSGIPSSPWTGSWIVAARRTYYDLVAAPIARASGFARGNIVLPNFTDFQMRLGLQIDYRNRITILGITARDKADLTAAQDINAIGNLSVDDLTFNDLATATWSHVAADNAVAQTTASFFQLGGSNTFSGVMTPEITLGLSMSTQEYEQLKDSLRRQGLPVEDLIRASGSYRFLFRKFSLSHSWLLALPGGHQVEAGMSVNHLLTEMNVGITVDARNQQLRQSNPRLSALPSFATDSRRLGASAHVQDLWHISDRWTLQPGVRLEYFGLINSVCVSPRLASTLLLDATASVHAAVGVYRQSPGYEKQFTPGHEIYLTRTVYDLSPAHASGLRAERAVHGVLGFECRPLDGISLAVEGYIKRLDDLIVPFVAVGTRYVVDPIPGGDPRSAAGWSAPRAEPADSITSIPVNAGSGEAAGLEIVISSLRRGPDDDVSWTLSYAWARSQRTWNGHTQAYDYDRRHSINADITLDLGAGWEVAVHWTYGTGFPDNPPVGIRPRVWLKTDSVTNTTTPTLDVDFKGVVFDQDRGGMDNLNSARLPDYHRLDVRITAHPRWFGWNWSVYLEVMNLYNRANVAICNYAVDRETLRIISIPLLGAPLLPTLGIHITL